jgi:hypothetical protein
MLARQSNSHSPINNAGRSLRPLPVVVQQHRFGFWPGFLFGHILLEGLNLNQVRAIYH